MAFKPGDVIVCGRYRVERLLGKGAFARVYLVRHLELDVDRAVKVLTRDTPGVGSTLFDDYQARFRLEAQLGARLDHPHVIKVHDFEAHEDALYLVMEYAPGGSLAELLKQEGPLPLDDFLRIAADAAAGLGAIHKELEIVHRDVKPSNILLTEGGRAKIGDLGLAQVEGGLSRRSVLGSEAIAHPGTPLYRSPEQEREFGYLQYPSDVYSLGCVMFEMLAGSPYKDQRPGTWVRDFRENVPAWIDNLVASCILKDQGARPWDGNEVAELLRDGRREPTVMRPQPAERPKVPEAPTLRHTESGLVIATPENVAQLLEMREPPDRVWWEKAEIELCLVPAGEFLMGRWVIGRYSDEDPQHMVYLDAYYIGRYPVTNAQYARFVHETGHSAPDEPTDYSWDGETPPQGKEYHPAVYVSWDDAAAYCKWAGLFLTREAEWEKAARGTDHRQFPWGDHDPTDRLCNFDGNEGGTTKVGRCSPQGDSPYGCADMAGNVWEWCADWYDADYYERSPYENPAGPSSGEYRMLRGGSWHDDAYYVRCAIRHRCDPDRRYANVGFRCARGFR
jgi:formylglycine-generating enzyme required for sulfatase activity